MGVWEAKGGWKKKQVLQFFFVIFVVPSRLGEIFAAHFGEIFWGDAGCHSRLDGIKKLWMPGGDKAAVLEKTPTEGAKPEKSREDRGKVVVGTLISTYRDVFCSGWPW